MSRSSIDAGNKPSGLNAFSRPGKFYRGNLHTHSNVTDGKYAPEVVCSLYRGQGYDFISLTDHSVVVDTQDLRLDDFTTIVGAELHAPALANGEVWHILAVGLPVDFEAKREAETGLELARRAAAAGAFIGLPHPAWYGATVEDLASIDVAHAVEIYNVTCEVHNARPDSTHALDVLLDQGKRLLAYAADDAHFSDEHDPSDAFAAWVMVKAESLDPDQLVEALKSGAFYSSQGPAILDVSLHGTTLAVATSPVNTINISGRTWHGDVRAGLGITRAEFDVSEFTGGYVRVTIRDAGGRRAWSNPIWLE